MEQAADLLKTALGEIDHLLTTKTVVGEPIQVGGSTIVPLVAVGFGFGGGGGSGEAEKPTAGKGVGAGTGAGGGIKPVALIIADKDGTVRVEPIRASASVIEKLGEAVARVIETRKKETAAT
jgi:uncharacterized spore protein YtfJ